MSLHYLHSIPTWIPLLVTTFLTLFPNLFSLQRKDASKLVGNWFQLLMVLFTKENFLCFLVLIFRLWSSLLRWHGFRSLFHITFQVRLPVYALKSAHIRAINYLVPRLLPLYDIRHLDLFLSSRARLESMCWVGSERNRYCCSLENPCQLTACKCARRIRFH